MLCMAFNNTLSPWLSDVCVFYDSCSVLNWHIMIPGWLSPTGQHTPSNYNMATAFCFGRTRGGVRTRDVDERNVGSLLVCWYNSLLCHLLPDDSYSNLLFFVLAKSELYRHSDAKSKVFFFGTSLTYCPPLMFLRRCYYYFWTLTPVANGLCTDSKRHQNKIFWLWFYSGRWRNVVEANEDEHTVLAYRLELRGGCWGGDAYRLETVMRRPHRNNTSDNANHDLLHHWTLTNA